MKHPLTRYHGVRRTSRLTKIREEPRTVYRRRRRLYQREVRKLSLGQRPFNQEEQNEMVRSLIASSYKL